ncbi:hypothetical protein WSM22_03390 [Cytophagales bacterium WSM2-2]|nr:hypothetical protein WSM22_03390 [Cytophagales bacterium WSM2-2]
MQISDLKIILDSGDQLDYTSPADLGIKLNRIVDDLTDISKRWGEYSYTVSFPKTKNNARVFEFPDTKGRTKIFVGKQWGCKVINNNQLLVDGIFELNEYDAKSYKGVIYSKLTELIDNIGSKKLSDLTALPTISWDYENTIAAHINADYKNSDETAFQFPYIFYKTPFISGGTANIIGTGTTANESYFGFTYNNYNAPPHFPLSTHNPLYYPQLPPAIYLVPIVTGIFSDIGWKLGGTFFERSEIKKIIIPFCGKVESYAGAISGTTGATLNLNKLLPSGVQQIDFIKSIINTFNLYFTINTNSKTISFDSYNNLFGDVLNPYDITRKVDLDSIDVTQAKVNSIITFTDDSDNYLVAGYDRPLGLANYYTDPTRDWLNRNNNIRSFLLPAITEHYPIGIFNNFFNKTSGVNAITLNFGYPNYFCYTVANNVSIDGVTWSNSQSAFQNISIPVISPQTPIDNQGNVFCSDSGTTYVEGNAASTMSYDGSLKLYYYYGHFKYDGLITGTTDSGAYQWAYINIATGGTDTHPTSVKVPICIASPFKLLTPIEKANLIGLLQSGQIDRFSEVGAEAQYLLMTYYSVGKVSGSYETTPYSLTFGENPNYQYENLYSFFHKNKYTLYGDSAVTKINMRMSEIDWNEMQVNRTLKFNDELYKLVKIENYDPINRTSELSMIKKINNGTTANARNIYTGITIATTSKLYSDPSLSGNQYEFNYDAGSQVTDLTYTGVTNGTTGVDSFGNVVVTINKLSNSGVAQKITNILYKVNGVVVHKSRFTTGATVTDSYTFITPFLSDMLEIVVVEQTAVFNMTDLTYFVNTTSVVKAWSEFVISDFAKPFSFTVLCESDIFNNFFGSNIVSLHTGHTSPSSIGDLNGSNRIGLFTAGGAFLSGTNEHEEGNLYGVMPSDYRVFMLLQSTCDTATDLTSSSAQVSGTLIEGDFDPFDINPNGSQFITTSFS